MTRGVQTAKYLQTVDPSWGQRIRPNNSSEHGSISRFGKIGNEITENAGVARNRGSNGLPLFLLRIDKSGRATKRFNATGFTLAEQGGDCPVRDTAIV
ncbi:MAG: short-chain fatty acyl-CoA regulator family protein [Roseobacter sp.]|jgi:hypothetical protein